MASANRQSAGLVNRSAVCTSPFSLCVQYLSLHFTSLLVWLRSTFVSVQFIFFLLHILLQYFNGNFIKNQTFSVCGAIRWFQTRNVWRANASVWRRWLVRIVWTYPVNSAWIASRRNTVRGTCGSLLVTSNDVGDCRRKNSPCPFALLLSNFLVVLNRSFSRQTNCVDSLNFRFLNSSLSCLCCQGDTVVMTCMYSLIFLELDFSVVEEKSAVSLVENWIETRRNFWPVVRHVFLSMSRGSCRPVLPRLLVARLGRGRDPKTSFYGISARLICLGISSVKLWRFTRM